MAMRILATWMVLCFANFCEDISCNVVKNLKQGVPAVKRWTDCKLEQPQPQYYPSDSLPTFHGHRNEIAAIFYTTVAPPIDTRVRYIQVPYVYSIHQMIGFNRRQELKKYYENYNNNNHITFYTTRHPEPLTRPAKPLTNVTQKIEMPPKSSLATHNIGDISNNQDTTENVIFEVTDPIQQTQKLSTKKPSSILSLPTNINTVSSLPSQLLELFHNISKYHKAQNSLTNIEKEEPTSIRTLQNENVFEVSKTTKRSSFDRVTISLDPRFINSSLPQFTDSSASKTSFATTAATKSSYQSPSTDNQLVPAEDEDLDDRFGGVVTVKNYHMLPAYEELPIININNTNTSSELVDNTDVNRINNTLAFIYDKSLLEKEKEIMKKDTYSIEELKINDNNDENDIGSENYSINKYTANEDISDNLATTTLTYEHIFPTIRSTKSTIVNTFETPETESKINTLKSENKKIDFLHPKEISVDLQEFDHNIYTFVKESTTTINPKEREDTKILALESNTVIHDITIEKENDLGRNHDKDKTSLSLEVTTRMPTNSSNNSSKNDDLVMQSPDFEELLTTTKKSANFIVDIDSDNIRANNITVTTVNYDAVQPDEKRTHAREFQVVTELNTLESLPISTTSSNDDFGMHYKEEDDERRLVTDTNAEPVKESITKSTVSTTSTSSDDDYDVEITDSLNDNFTDELVTPIANVAQRIPFDNIEERTLPTYDFLTEIEAVFGNGDNYNTEINLGKSLIEIPEYLRVESVTSRQKVITSSKPADIFTSIPSSDLEFSKDELEKNIIDMNIEYSATDSVTHDENVTNTSIQNVSSTTILYKHNGPGHRRTEKMVENVIPMPQDNNMKLVTEEKKEASISKLVYYKNIITTSTLNYATDYETETNSILSDFSQFIKKERINLESKEDSNAFTDPIAEKATFGSDDLQNDDLQNDLYVNVDQDDSAGDIESSTDTDLYEDFLEKNLTAGAKIMK